MKLKRIFSVSLLALLTTAPFTIGYSATLVENVETSAAVRLQLIFTEKQNGMVELNPLNTSNQHALYSNPYFPAEYMDIRSHIHEKGHQWPKKYLDFTFKHGLLNTFISFYDSSLFKEMPSTSNKVAIGGFHNSIFQRPVDENGKSIEYSKVNIKHRYDTYVSLWKALQKGLHQNELLLMVGGNYLKHKVRGEYAARNKSLYPAAEREKEAYRCDRLQDIACTIKPTPFV